jgi:hypothetical protein
MLSPFIQVSCLWKVLLALGRVSTFQDTKMMAIKKDFQVP